MNKVLSFMNETLGEVRTLVISGNPWFVAADVCKILDIDNPTHALTRLDGDEKNTLVLNEGIRGRGNPNVNIINEYGLWQLVLGSRKPQAKEFKRWLTHEVIPAIRKSDGYLSNEEELSSDARDVVNSFKADICKWINEHVGKTDKFETTIRSGNTIMTTTLDAYTLRSWNDITVDKNGMVINIK